VTDAATGDVFAPDVLVASFVWPDGSEVIATLGGSGEYDGYLQTVEPGVYRFECPSGADEGKAHFAVKVTHAVGGTNHLSEIHAEVWIREIPNAFANREPTR